MSLLLTLNIFHTLCVSVVNFEQINVDWVVLEPKTRKYSKSSTRINNRVKFDTPHSLGMGLGIKTNTNYETVYKLLKRQKNLCGQYLPRVGNEEKYLVWIFLKAVVIIEVLFVENYKTWMSELQHCTSWCQQGDILGIVSWFRY